MHAFGFPAVVGVNRIAGDTDRELDTLVELSRELGADEVAVSDGFARGGEGTEDLAKAVLSAVERPSTFRPINEPGTPLREQIDHIATRLYGAAGAELAPEAERSLRRLEERELAEFPVCMAKSHMSLSHDLALGGSCSRCGTWCRRWAPASWWPCAATSCACRDWGRSPPTPASTWPRTAGSPG